MRSHIFDRRRADRFAQLLDEAAGRPRTHRRWDVDDELADLVAVAVGTGSLPTAPDPTAEFRTSVRAMLMAKIERDGIGITAVDRAAHAANRAALAGKTQSIRLVSRGAGRTRVAVLAGVTAGALALSGVSAASTKALPGEPLYQVKLSTERAQLALAGSDLSRGMLRLEFARGRLLEAQQVAPDLLAEVLTDMDGQTRNGVNLLTITAADQGDRAPLNYILGFVDQQRADLEELRDALGPAGVEATAESAALLDQVQARAKQLRTALDAGCDPTVDPLGPDPASC